MIGPRGRVSEVLTRKRPLSLTMIRKLKDEWHLPADVLVRSYALRKTTARTAGRANARRRLVA